MGERLETRRQETKENKKTLENIKNDQELLDKEFSRFSELENLAGLVDDEVSDSISEVGQVRDTENDRLQTETGEANQTRSELRSNIRQEISKLESGLNSLKQMEGTQFGGSAKEAIHTYETQIAEWQKLLDDLSDEGGGFSASLAGGFEGSFERPVSNELQERYNALSRNGGSIGQTTAARAVDFGKLDNKVGHEVISTITDTQKMFPDLNMNFVGSAQKRNQLIENDLRAYYTKAYNQNYPDADSRIIDNLVNEHIAEDMGGLQIEENTIAQSLYVENNVNGISSIIQRYNGITINEAIGSDYATFQRVKQSDVQSKWKPVGCDTPKATVDHELGHQISAITKAYNDPEISSMFNNFSRLSETEKSERLSGYSATNIHEFIAESWSEYQNNASCRETARAVSERMLKLYRDNHLLR